MYEVDGVDEVVLLGKRNGRGEARNLFRRGTKEGCSVLSGGAPDGVWAKS